MKKISAFLTVCFIFALNVFGQERCFTPEEAQKTIKTLDAPLSTAKNSSLRKELIQMRDKSVMLNTKIGEDLEKNQNLIPQLNETGIGNLLRVCEIVRQNGWLTEKVIGKDGSDALKFLIINNRGLKYQNEFLPVLIEAAKKGYFGKPELASVVDNLRIGRGLPQIFGTQAKVTKDAVYLYPLLNDEKIDEWRKAYNLPPLAAEIGEFEKRYFLPVLKSQKLSALPNLKKSAIEKTGEIAALGISDSENEIVKVETNLVNLNLRILTKDLKTVRDINFSKDDFAVSEDDKPQAAEFFSAAETPFTLVLILDFSGSTTNKRDLIKKAAQSFVEYARPADKIAVIAFASETEIVSEPTTDKAVLEKKIADIEITGRSAIWDSIKFAYDNILKTGDASKRSAVVVMTDGIDSSQNTMFADLLETVRQGDTIVFPVYIDTFGNYRNRLTDGFRRLGQQSLTILAEESGGQIYKANDLRDLNGVYEQVIDEIGKVYSVAYQSNNDQRDGGWRKVSVTINNRPDLIVKTKSGYYAK